MFSKDYLHYTPDRYIGALISSVVVSVSVMGLIVKLIAGIEWHSKMSWVMLDTCQSSIPCHAMRHAGCVGTQIYLHIRFRT